MGVLIGFAVGYVLGTRSGEGGFEELRTTVKTITSSEELKDLVTGGLAILSDVIRSSVTSLTERSESGTSSLRAA